MALNAAIVDKIQQAMNHADALKGGRPDFTDRLMATLGLWLAFEQMLKALESKDTIEIKASALAVAVLGIAIYEAHAAKTEKKLDSTEAN